MLIKKIKFASWQNASKNVKIKKLEEIGSSQMFVLKSFYLFI
jgi:hypothetical protein